MNLWPIPRLWEGETVAVLASGPSMSPTVAAAVQGRCRVVAVNNQGIATVDAKGRSQPAIAPWADVLYAADRLWWQNNREAAAKFAGVKVTILPNGWHDLELHVPGVHVVGNGGCQGYDDRPDYIRSGWNSGYQAVQVAAKFGAARILLLGFDMHAHRGEHWHGDHRWRPGYQSRYELFANAFNKVAKDYAARDVAVINCTAGSALKAFPIMTLEEALDGVLDVRESEARPACQGAQGAGRVGAQTDRRAQKEEAQAMT